MTAAGSSYALQAEGENGALKLDVVETMFPRYTAVLGYLRRTLNGQMCKISLTPFDSWALLPGLFPAYLGVGTGGSSTSDLLIGRRPHDYAGGGANTNAATKLWTPDGRLYTVARSALTKPPNMRLGVGQPLFEGIEITGLAVADPALRAGTPMIAVVESAASDPDTAGFAPDFINGHWLGTWGSVSGFASMEVEDYWTLTCNAKYSLLTIQNWPTHMKLDSVEYFIKGRMQGPTHTQIISQMLTHVQGATLAESSGQDLVLTGPAGTAGGSAKTVTLKDCELVMENAGIELGGTKLNTGEIGFYTKVDFTSGAPTPALQFSA
jgi:hypothetical protein